MLNAHKAGVLELNSDKQLNSIPGLWTMSKILVTTTASFNCNYFTKQSVMCHGMSNNGSKWKLLQTFTSASYVLC